MELFREDGCLSDEGLHALTAGQLDELGRLEAAEHLAYCDKCTDRYTALLTADALADPPRDVRRTVMSTIWAVSYTHLDVYKRQAAIRSGPADTRPAGSERRGQSRCRRTASAQ